MNLCKKNDQNIAYIVHEAAYYGNCENFSQAFTADTSTLQANKVVHIV